MPLFWIVSETEAGKTVFIQESGDLLMARLKASMAGLEGKFVEMHALTPSMARTIPKKMQGRPLSIEEAAGLLKKMQK
jgi:hypothetical protein